MSAKQSIKEPAYYSKFQCLGDKCPQDCCHGWCIEWEKEAVERLKAADCSEELINLINSSFCASPAHADLLAIIHNDNGICPFLENGLCRIQKELGEEYFSNTCRKYPRHITKSMNFGLRCCNTSCFGVLDFLCSDENSVDMMLKNVSSASLPGTMFSKIDMMNHPAIEFFGEISAFFIDILSDKSHSIDTSVVLCAVAAKTIDKYVSDGKAKQIPALLKQLVPQVKDPAQIATLENIKPNYSLKLGLGQGIMDIISLQDIKIVIENNMPFAQQIKFNYIANMLEDNRISAEKYIEGENKFRKAFAGREFVIRNIALNIFMECDMPFKNKEYSLFENICCFASQVAVIKLTAAAAGYEEETAEATEFKFKKTLATAARNMAHNTEYITRVMNLMKQYNCTSPAHLAYVLK